MNGTADDDADPDGDELARLELQVRPGDVARQVGAEVALLDDLFSWARATL